jgi:hypothetical protein
MISKEKQKSYQFVAQLLTVIDDPLISELCLDIFCGIIILYLCYRRWSSSTNASGAGRSCATPPGFGHMLCEKLNLKLDMRRT